MYELLNEIKETYVLHLPQSQERPYAKDIWYEEVKLLKEKLEEKFNCTITEEGLRKAAHVRNELRKAQLDMYHLQKLDVYKRQNERIACVSRQWSAYARGS